MPDAQLPMTKLPKHFFLFNCIQRQLFLKNGRIVANGAHRKIKNKELIILSKDESIPFPRKT